MIPDQLPIRPRRNAAGFNDMDDLQGFPVGRFMVDCSGSIADRNAAKSAALLDLSFKCHFKQTLFANDLYLLVS